MNKKILKMNINFIENQEFQSINFSQQKLSKGDYEKCSFKNCNFANVDLSETNFIESEFKNCDFSMAKLTNTVFRNVKFNICKMLGLHFEDCNKFGLSAEFESCQLNLSSFFKMNLKNTKFKDCLLLEVDFSEANLTSLNLSNCNLLGAIFDNSVLEKTDFRTAFNYSIDPETNKIKKAKFSKDGIAGLLNKYNIEIS